MSEQETVNQEVYTSNNDGFNDFNALQIRLNTEPVLKEIEYYLTGVKETWAVNEKGEPVIIRQQVSKPKGNPEGIHTLMAWLKTRFNTQVVQGNFDKFEDLSDFMAYEREDLTEFVLHNLYDWDIQEREAAGIVDMIIGQQKLFLSRLVGNAERNSYSNTIQHKESSNNTLDKRGGGWRIPGFK